VPSVIEPFGAVAVNCAFLENFYFDTASPVLGGLQGHAVLAWRPEPIRRRVSGASVR